jgi:hypothetical protein
MKKRLLIGSGMISALLGVGLLLSVPGAAERLVVEIPLAQCDLMVVPEGGARERLSSAVELMSGGACKYLMVTGDPDRPQAGGGEQFLADLEPHQIVRPPFVSSDTRSDVLAALELMRERGYESVLFVTSPYHTRRLSLVARRVFEGTGMSFGVRPSTAFYMDYKRWWASTHGRDAVIGEYVKLLYYKAVE